MQRDFLYRLVENQSFEANVKCAAQQNTLRALLHHNLCASDEGLHNNGCLVYNVVLSTSCLTLARFVDGLTQHARCRKTLWAAFITYLVV
jgi:hypothetical protein